MCKSAYIITKPLQYINATNILDENIKDCFLIVTFKNADIFYTNIVKYSTYWENIYYFKNRTKALFNILFRLKKYNKVYLDSDFGFFIRIILLLFFNKNVFVYEEGYGTYRANIRDKKNIKNKLFLSIDRVLGKNYIGGFFNTKGIYVYNPDAYLKLVSPNSKKIIFKFKNSFREHLTNYEEFNSIFNFDDINKIEGENVILYLTDWEINDNYINIISQYDGYFKILKPHPHIKNSIRIEKDFDYIIDNFIPAEILIEKILQNSNKLILIHQNSSALIYFSNYDKLKVINIENNDDITYTKIVDSINNSDVN